jgi:tetratricopeptide (TPR) repeat protein
MDLAVRTQPTSPIGERFRELRRQAGLTSTALAAPKYTVSYVSQIEAGRRVPSKEALSFFAERLGVSARYLATGVPDGIEFSLRYHLEAARHEVEGRPKEAEGILRRLMAQADQYGLSRLHSLAQAALGDALRSQRQMREAIDAYEQALGGDLPERERGMAVGGLARAYRSVGDLTYAADVVETHLSRQAFRPLDPTVATDLQSVLISIYFERGDIIKAERAARRALDAADGSLSPEVRAIAYWHASRVLAETRQWEEALELASRARILLEEVDDRRRVGRLHNAYAFICLEQEPPRVDDARRHLELAESILVEASSGDDLATVFTERSRLALLEEQPSEALDHAERALSHAATDELEVARSLFLKGRALAMLGRRAESRDALQEAAALFEQQGARQQQASCWRELGELELAAGDVPSAVEALRAGLAALDPRRSRA